MWNFQLVCFFLWLTAKKEAGCCPPLKLSDSVHLQSALPVISLPYVAAEYAELLRHCDAESCPAAP